MEEGNEKVTRGGRRNQGRKGVENAREKGEIKWRHAGGQKWEGLRIAYLVQVV